MDVYYGPPPPVINIRVYDPEVLAKPLPNWSWQGSSLGGAFMPLKWLSIGILFILVSVVLMNVLLAVLLQGYNVHLEETSRLKHRTTFLVCVFHWVSAWVESYRSGDSPLLAVERFRWMGSRDADIVFAALVSSMKQKLAFPPALSEEIRRREEAGFGRVMTGRELYTLFTTAGDGTAEAAPLTPRGATQAVVRVMDLYGRRADGEASWDESMGQAQDEDLASGGTEAQGDGGLDAPLLVSGGKHPLHPPASNLPGPYAFPVATAEPPVAAGGPVTSPLPMTAPLSGPIMDQEMKGQPAPCAEPPVGRGLVVGRGTGIPPPPVTRRSTLPIVPSGGRVRPVSLVPAPATRHVHSATFST
eukprot:Hpha_TRINITY_DN16627_c0_g10::TRINITY_DN16627_c0_g10_i1::g.180411::m.180411